MAASPQFPDFVFQSGGNWTLTNGGLQQTAEKEFVRALIGDRSWKDYTLELRARKLGGHEGFLTLFGIQDDEERNWWNIGGWENTAHAVEFGESHDRKPACVENNRWYDIKIQTQGTTVKCWLNGRLIHDIKDTVSTPELLYATSALDNRTGDIIVKEVNAGAEPIAVDLIFNGIKALNTDAKAVVLSSDGPSDENSLENPGKVAPKFSSLPIAGNVIKHNLPGNSLTVLRIAPKNTVLSGHSRN